MEEQLTKKQRRELKKQEKQKVLEEAQQKARNKSMLMWLSVIAGVVLIVWGIVASSGSDNSVNVDTGLIPAVTEQDHVKGNSNADVVIIEYSDFQCPACGAYFPVVKELEKSYGDKIAVVYRHYPLVSLHANAEAAARASEAANLQGKFWDMHDKLFENQRVWADLSSGKVIDKFKSYAKEIGLDVNKFSQDFSSSVVKDRVRRDSQSALHAGLSGTPSFFVNGEKIQNPRGVGPFKFIIDNLLNNAHNNS